MRALATVLIALHALAHLVGFRAAFWPAAGAPTRTVLSGGLLSVGPFGQRALGIAWLLLALGYAAAAALLGTRSERALELTLGLSSVSLVMCCLFWPAAKIGAFIDLGLILIALGWSRDSSLHLARRFERELTLAQLPPPPPASPVIDEKSIASLPEPVRRYLQFMGVLGRPRDWSLRAHFEARFRRDQGDWLRCEALQYDSRLPISRFFLMRLSLKHILPVTVSDLYLRGHGRMEAKAFDLLPVVSGQGYEIDVGELVTYLNDAILMAPSLLLGPETSFEGAGEQAFDVTLRDAALRVTARVSIAPSGAPLDFSTTDRFFDAPNGARIRTQWRTPVSGWQASGGRMLPTRARAIWQLPSGPFTYADFTIDPARIAFNVPPS